MIAPKSDLSIAILRIKLELIVIWTSLPVLTNYTTVYGNGSLSTVGLKGTQRPDIIAKARDGVYHVWEFASQSQASGRGAAALARKISIMSSNNPSVVFHPIIPW